MSHPSSAPPAPTSSPAQHLTKSILTLHQTILNIKADVANGIAPSILLPADPDATQNTTTSNMILLTLEPSTADITAHLAPLATRLDALEAKMRASALWHVPAEPPQAPEYSIIDVGDLSGAIAMLEEWCEKQVAGALGARWRCAAHGFFAEFEWMWDGLHREFYARGEEGGACVYLSRWRLDAQRQVWGYVSMRGTEVQPDVAAGMLGSWEDWRWDDGWREWYLDVSDVEGECRVYASRWEAQRETNPDEPWGYVGSG